MTEIEQSSDQTPAPRQKRGWLAAGGIIGAIVASSCCILPLVLVLAGVSGAWIGSLTALDPYKPYFIVVTLAFIGAGFWHVYFKSEPPCEDGSYCAKPQSNIITQIALWVGLAIVLLAATIDWWAPFFY
ncbi:MULTISPECIES: mercuric transporter MerT family protein [Maricaulis]|jgi:mercuric ion transport protein|uniref:Mercuric transport protein MerT n=2 Tax=Maricaulis maris TaxID=74318 RepID=Q0AM74_MARMM|nr:MULTISPECIES: mercuric transporter MerT family protein [Maricaulis]ABI66619.1 Mercuric transport protein MerT [Maricaulis maris MCS10]MAC90017.1 mercury transporter MerT [Maricaulis sp.]OLF71861.1 mercury transporter MerT [Maricaulis sp. W15]RKQ89540.1 mercuric ion transport protein [Maricaulis maris]|tara:strand:+ start:218 stop:604 length:387 start_codon:yes stop_codon:yes gene_type:complete